MEPDQAPWHAHIYARAGETATAQALRAHFAKARSTGEIPGLSFIGRLAEGPIGPHPLPQFEIHFVGSAKSHVRAILQTSGLTALIHPLTDDDLADHTRLAQWIGEPLALDHSVLDPPGVNKGVARFGKSDF